MVNAIWPRANPAARARGRLGLVVLRPAALAVARATSHLLEVRRPAQGELQQFADRFSAFIALSLFLLFRLRLGLGFASAPSPPIDGRRYSADWGKRHKKGPRTSALNVALTLGSLRKPGVSSVRCGCEGASVDAESVQARYRDASMIRYVARRQVANSINGVDCAVNPQRQAGGRAPARHEICRRF